jgi:hypothetical protein
MSEADYFPERKLLLGGFAGLSSRNHWCDYLGGCNRYH